MRRICISILLGVILGLQSFAQGSFTLSGHVRDASSGEDLVGVTLFIPDLQRGTVTNNYGFFSLPVSEGDHELNLSYIGYQTLTVDLQIPRDQKQDFELLETSLELEEAVVKANSQARRVLSTQMGTETLPMKSIRMLPSIAGETDVLKIIQLMPGIQSQSEGSSGFAVRGGNYDQNLVLLDEAVVYNPGHVFGIFSIFNDDAINSVTVNKGDMPANHGGRLSSVVDIVAKEGNSKNFEAKGSIGLLSSKLTLEGPLVKDKSSFIISARRTYLDLLAGPALGDSKFYFYDLNAKVNYKLGEKDRLFFSLYNGKDDFVLNAEDNRFTWKLPWGNFTSTLRWNHLLGDKLFMNTSLIYNSFYRDFTEIQDGNLEEKKSKVSDQTLKLDLNYYTSFGHKIKLGGQATYHTFTNEDNASLNPEQYAREFSTYLLDEFSLTKRFLVNVGVRYSLFQNVGSYEEYLLDDEGQPREIINSYEGGEVFNSYQHIEPRLAIRYMINDRSSLKASYTKSSQYVHLVSSTGSTMPTETWIPSTKIIQPQLSTQYALGYFRNVKEGNYQLAAEIFYKEMENQIEFSDAFVPDFTNSTDQDYVFGSGTARGIELSVRKTEGKLQGWLAYTLSDSKRKFDDLNRGEEFYALNDVRHDFSVSGSYRLTSKWSFGIGFVYRTGKPFTIPESRYFANGEVIDEYSSRNNFRLPSYNRLDISAIYTPERKDKRLKTEWVFAIYNVYNRYNPTYIYFADEGSVKENSFTTQPKSIALIPFMPSVSWRFKF